MSNAGEPAKDLFNLSNVPTCSLQPKADWAVAAFWFSAASFHSHFFLLLYVFLDQHFCIFILVFITIVLF